MDLSERVLFRPSCVLLLLSLVTLFVAVIVVAAPRGLTNGASGYRDRRSRSRSGKTQEQQKNKNTETKNKQQKKNPDPTSKMTDIKSVIIPHDKGSKENIDMDKLKTKFSGFLPNEKHKLESKTKEEKDARRKKASKVVGASANALAWQMDLPRIDHYSVWGYEWLHCVADRFRGETTAANLVLGTTFANIGMSKLEGALAKAKEKCTKGNEWFLLCQPARDADKPWTASEINWKVFNKKPGIEDKWPDKGCYEEKFLPLLTKNEHEDKEATYISKIFESCCETKTEEMILDK